MTSGPVFRPRTHAIRARRGRTRAGYAQWDAGVPGITILNQWTATFSQPATFGLTPPALQSSVIALNSSTSTGGGSGTPTAGNWLIAITGWNQSNLTAATHAAADDIHSFWRPGDITASNWAVSQASANSRASVWYTPNLARVPQDVYVAPSGAVNGRSVLVIELGGMGPWDTVAGISANYAAAATSLSLSLSAPAALSLVIGAVCGDLTGAGQAFRPSGWTPLATVTAQDGSGHTCDTVLTSAYTVTSGSVSVSASATSATDLAGVLIAIETNAASPIPAGQNPNWPLTHFEGAFGSGFQSAPDSMTWTDLTSRCWSWEETTGIQYQLGQIQATQLQLELDNNDNMLSTDNPAAYFYTASGANWAPQSAQYDQAVSADSPLAWWKLADAAGTTTIADSSGNGHTGTATSVTFGNADEAVTGNTSASFASASSSHVLTSYNPAFAALTVEGWVNLNGLTQPTGFGRVIANSFSDSDSKGFQLYRNGGSAQFWIGNGTANSGVIGGTVPATGWTHLAGTYDGATITLYVNGVSAGTTSFSGTIPAGSASGIGIGYNPAYSGDFINGLIAECAVYGTALTAQQVAAHYTAGPAGTGTPLRLRMALGTIGGVAVNRWYCIQRNAEQWPQEITEDRRRWSPATGTDLWYATSAYGPTPYRGEVLQDSPYAWWPCDDQPGSGGVLPTSLRNAAPGNSNALSITLSPAGATAQLVYSTAGAAPVTNNTSAPPPLIAQYAVGQNAGWMFGDPQSSPLASTASGGAVTAQPGSSAWTQTGSAGNTGGFAFFLACNDTAFPPLSGGITVEGWFNFAFFGTSTGQTSSIYGGSGGDQSGQPYANVTIIELATDSAGVCILQLDRDTGNLNFITYNGSTPTTHAIYTSADLRTANWHHFAITTTASAWTVYVDGGQTATASGTGAGMTSAWTWLLAAGDTSTHGGTGTANIARSGNVSLAHLAVYPAQLPAYRIIAHYWAAATAFGLLPAPQGVSASMVGNASGGQGNTWASDGSVFQGTYTGTLTNATSEISAIVTANAGSYSSGPSSWAVTAAIGERIFAQVTWTTGLAPLFTIYTAASHGSETGASTTVGSLDSYTAGYGSGATGTGNCHVSGGSGASPPTAATATGDTVAQRLERILSYAAAAGLGYGGVTTPCRAIDPASLPVQAATDIGGQQAGQNLTNIAQSDGGLLFIDNNGTLTYWQKSHLAAQYASPVWTFTPDAPPTPGAPLTAIPYDRETFQWVGDPQRVWNSITVTPFSPDGASLPLIIPTSTAGVVASQQQYGQQPLQVNSYLQSTSEMSAQADWLFDNFGQLQVRVENLEIDAAAYPPAWPVVLGASVGDVATVQNWAIGNAGVTGTFRVSGITRRFSFAGQNGQVRGSIALQLDFEPSSYWS